MHGLIVTLILLQLILPSAVLAAPPLSPPAIPITKPLPTPPTQENPVDATFEDVAVAPPLDDRPAPQAALPVALFVRLTSDRTLLHPGEKATLIVNAWRATEEKLDGALLTLELPPELKQAKGEVELQWRLPELEKTAIFSQTVAVQLVGGAFPFETAVVRAVLHTAATEQFSENRAEVVFGLDSRAPEPPASPVAKAVLREKGLVLQGRYGDVTVLVEEGSAAAETTFTYTDGYRLGEAQPAALTATKSVTAPQALTTTGMITTHPALTTTTPPTTPAVLTTTTIISAAAGLSSTGNLLYLPVVSGEGDVAQTTQQTPVASGSANAIPDTPAPSADELPVDNGVSFVRRWQLDAALGDEQITKFSTRIGLVIDASWLLEQKFDPERLTLYTREDPKQPWEEVPDVHYDAGQRAFIARIGHFSEYSLGLISTSVVGESLPDVSSFGTDLFTGAATVDYGIELPLGPGGLAPQLSLNYSSATVDSQRWDNNKNQSDGYRVQAGLPGIGWNLGGLGYIAWTSKGIDVGNGNDDHYSFVFNGTSDEFLYTDTQTESFAKISKNLTTQYDPTDGNVKVTGTGSWTVTTRDGTQHIFGGAPVHYSNSSTTSNQSILLDDIGALDTYRWVNKWYLSKSIDGNGNYIEYSYLSDKRETNCSANNKYRGAGGWYYRAMRPASITWGGNQTTGAPHRMKVLFTYESRTDTGIWKRDDVCTQSMYSTERLKKITVQVHSENVWKPLREYELNYDYTAGYHQHSWLNSIAHYGFASNGTRTAAPLQTYSFAYTIGAIHSEVYLQEANNGWGGKVVYGYAAPATWRCAIDNTTNCDPVAYRRQVNGKTVYDGTTSGSGNWTYHAYGYAEGLYRIYKNDPVEFLGYPSAWSITYARNTYNESKITEHWFYRDNGFTARGDIANNPDPRLGRPDFERVLQGGTSGCNYPVGNRCKLAETDPTYTALTGSGTSWTPISSYTAHPRWVRQDSVVNWVDGAALAQVFTYAAAQQNNTQYGNVTKVEERDGSTGGTLLRRTETEYFPNTSAHVVSLPARVQVYDAASACAAEQRYVYGAYYSGSTYVTNVGGTYQTPPTNARLVKSQVALSACSATVSIPDTDNGWAITRYAYDAYGNQTTENRLGSNNLVTTTDFDATYHLFPTRRYRTVGPTTYDETAFYYGVNPSGSDPVLSDDKAQWGALGEWCGVNEVCTRYAYDDYGRVNAQWDGLTTGASWSSATNAAVTWGYTMYGSGGWTRNVVTEWRAPRCYGNFSRKLYDGLGQLIQVQGPQQDWTVNKDGCSPGSNLKEVDVSYDYDALGNQITAGVPVAQTGSGLNRAANWGAGYTATVYDVLGRPKSTTAPNGEV